MTPRQGTRSTIFLFVKRTSALPRAFHLPTTPLQRKTRTHLSILASTPSPSSHILSNASSPLIGITLRIMSFRPLHTADLLMNALPQTHFHKARRSFNRLRLLGQSVRHSRRLHGSIFGLHRALHADPACRLRRSRSRRGRSEPTVAFGELDGRRACRCIAAGRRWG
jgi:hypothetical protein